MTTIRRFNTYAEAFEAARNAFKDGYNTIIREAEWNGEKAFFNEYFINDNERIHIEA